MTEKEIYELIEKLQNTRYEIEDVEDSLDAYKEKAKAAEEIEDFLYNISKNEDINEDIRKKASELWSKM